MVRFLQSFEKLHATDGALIVLVDGVVFNCVFLVPEDILWFEGTGLELLGKFGFGLELLDLKGMVGLYFFHDFVGELFSEGGFGFGGGGKERVNSFHCLLTLDYKFNYSLNNGYRINLIFDE